MAASELRLSSGDEQLEATFVPDAGMICSSLCHRGTELLAQNAGVGAYAREGATMGIPLLYPWANRLAAFDYAVAGRAVTIPHDRARIALDARGLPIHGVIGGRLQWTVTRGPAADRASIEAELSWEESRPELFEVFPFAHQLRYVGRLTPAGLEIELSVHASGETVVPVAFGFHPYLAPVAAARERWIVELPAMRRLRCDSKQIPAGPGDDVPAERFALASREFDDGFDSLEGRACFSVCDGARRIAVEFLQGYPCAQVFAPLGGRYVCFEPMTAPTNALRSGAGLVLLEPGQSYRAGFRVSIEAPSP